MGSQGESDNCRGRTKTIHLHGMSNVNRCHIPRASFANSDPFSAPSQLLRNRLPDDVDCRNECFWTIRAVQHWATRPAWLSAMVRPSVGAMRRALLQRSWRIRPLAGWLAGFGTLLDRPSATRTSALIKREASQAVGDSAIVHRTCRHRSPQNAPDGHFVLLVAIGIH